MGRTVAGPHSSAMVRSSNMSTYTGSLVMLDEAGGQRREGSARPGQKCPSVGCKPLGT